MTRANDYFVAKWPDTGQEIVTNKTRPRPKIDDWNWIDALQMAMPVFAQLGVMDHSRNDGPSAYYENMYQLYNVSYG
jgi:hypothetical protein